MRSIARIFKLLGAKLLAVGSFYQSNPTRFRRHKRAAKILLIKTIPVVVLALVSLIIAQIFFKDMPIPPAIQFALLGFWTIVLAIRLYPKISPFIIVGAAAALLAAGIVFTPPVKVTVAFFSVLFIALIARRIEFGVLALLIMTSSIMHDSVIPKPFTFGGMGFGASELLLLAMLSIVLFIMGAERRFDELKSPMVLPMLLFCFAIFFSILVSYNNNASAGLAWEFRNVYNNARPLFLYLLFFVVAIGIRTEGQLKFIFRCLVWICVAVSILIVIQYFLGTEGKSVFLSGRFSPLRVGEPLSEDQQEVARSIPPGLALTMLFFLYTLTINAYGLSKKKLIGILTPAVLGIGLIFSFTRNYWLSMAIGVFIIWLFANPPIKLRLAVVVVSVLVFAIGGSLAVARLAPSSAGQKFANALLERFESIYQPETMRSSSIEARKAENRKTLERIKENPFFGIGVGNPVQYTTVYNEWTGSSTIKGIHWIHNSYLELWLVYGILGLFSFALLSLTFIVRCYTLYKKARDPAIKALGVAFLASYIAYLVRATVTMSVLHETFNIVTVALMWGCIEAAHRIYEEKKQAQVTENDKDSALVYVRGIAN